MKFGKYVARRLLQMIPVILAIICICFLIIHLAPGDPATILAGETATDEYIAELTAQFGLDQPLWKQLLLYIGNVFQGNLGESFADQIPVSQMLWTRMKVTLMLVLPSEILAICIGTLLGLIAAKHENKIQDHLISNASIVLYCMPTFWLGMMLMLLFAPYGPSQLDADPGPDPHLSEAGQVLYCRSGPGRFHQYRQSHRLLRADRIPQARPSQRPFTHSDSGGHVHQLPLQRRTADGDGFLLAWHGAHGLRCHLQSGLSSHYGWFFSFRDHGGSRQFYHGYHLHVS